MLLQKESSVSGCFCLSPGADALSRLVPGPPEGLERRWVSQRWLEGHEKPHFFSHLLGLRN